MMMRRTVRSLPPGVTVGSLRMLNTYESAGVFEGRYSRLDDLVLEHLHVQQELTKLDAWQETLCRMIAEKYSRAEICLELGVSPSTLTRMLRKVGMALLGDGVQ